MFEKIYMIDGNSVWMKDETKNNIKKIHDLLFEERAKCNNKKAFRMSYSQIKHETGIANNQVRFAIWILAFKIDPWVRTKAKSYMSKNNKVMIVNKVELIKTLEKNNGD